MQILVRNLSLFQNRVNIPLLTQCFYFGEEKEMMLTCGNYEYWFGSLDQCVLFGGAGQ